MPQLENVRHEIVAQRLAIGETQKAALLAAGYTEKSATYWSGRVAHRPEVEARVAELLKERENAVLVTVDKMHRRYSEMFEADIADIVEVSVDGSMFRFKPITQWPKIWRQMLSGFDVKELFERSKDGGNASWDKIGELVKIKFVQVKDLGELLGRLKPVDAFVQQKQEQHLHLHLEEQITNRITAGRRRAAERNASKPRETTTVSK